MNMKERLNQILHPETKRQVFLLAFGVNLILAALVFIPFTVAHGGIFALCEDFAGETLPYRYLARDAIRSGDIFWNWNLDLGSDFMQSFGASWFLDPFKLIPTLLPESMMLTCSAWLMILRYAVAGGAMGLYLRRHFESRGVWLTGSVMYAFCGFQATILVFDMLSDVSVFFPFYMTAMEELVEENKKGRYAFWVFYLACMSVTMFVNVFVFSIIWFLFIYGEKTKEFFIRMGKCIGEGILGGMMALISILPTIYAILGDSRASLKLTGAGALTFDSTRVMFLIKGWLFPSESMSNISSIYTAEWMTVSAYLPLVSILLLLAYCHKHGSDRMAKLMKFLVVMSFVPFLNNLFMMESLEPYCRWYFMMLFTAVIISCRVINDYREYTLRMEFGLLGFIMILFVYTVYRIPWYGEGQMLSVYRPSRFLLGVGMGFMGIIYTFYLFMLKDRKKMMTWLFAGVAAFSVSTHLIVCYDYLTPSNNNAAEKYNSAEAIANEVVNTGKVFEEENIDVLPYRAVFWRHYYNYGMVYGVPGKASFLSVIENSIYKWSSNIGNERLHAIPPVDQPGEDEIASVKYYVLKAERKDLNLIKSYDNGNRMLYLYEDPDALPVAYTYDSYITESDYLKMPASIRTTAAMKAMVVPEESVGTVSQILPQCEEQFAVRYNREVFKEYQREHLDEVCENFSRTNKTFSFTMNTDGEKYIYVSVPYSPFWHAEINGTKAEIIESNGMMAVRSIAGNNEVSFAYTPKMTYFGLAGTAAGFVCWVVYLLYNRRKRNA